MSTMRLAWHLNRALFRAVVVFGLLGSLMIYGQTTHHVDRWEWPTGPITNTERANQ